MDLLEKHKENLIIQRALLLFFTNYTNHRYIIEEMEAENGGFAHAWEKLYNESKERYEKDGGMWIIHNHEIYLLFATKLTYKAQALFIEKVLKAYGEESKGDIDFAIEMEEITKKHIEKHSKN